MYSTRTTVPAQSFKFLRMSSPDRQSNLHCQTLYHPWGKSGTYQGHLANRRYTPHILPIGQEHWFYPFLDWHLLAASGLRVSSPYWHRLSCYDLANGGTQHVNPASAIRNGLLISARLDKILLFSKGNEDLASTHLWSSGSSVLGET